jgi:hypothetical protein
MKCFESIKKKQPEITLEDYIKIKEDIKYGTDIHNFYKYTRHSINSNTIDSVKQSINDDIFLSRILK